MRLTTPVQVEKADFDINHQSKMLLIGSCFAENIGNKLSNLKYNTLINPFGIIYNPNSIATLLSRVLQQNEFTENNLHKNSELWFSFEHHSFLNSLNKTQHLKKINKILKETRQFLKTTNVLILTFGTAFVYKYKPDDSIVANCHKVPNTQFEKSRLSVKEIVTNFYEILKLLFQFNPKLKVIFTISPVRHVKDGIVNNTKSKAILHLAVEQLINEYSKKCTYFQAYEIMMDELRDYRFYKDDLLHPTKLAVEYIWEKFESSYFSTETFELNRKIISILQQLYHQPNNENTESHINGLKKLLIKMQQFQKESHICFKKEIEKLSNTLILKSSNGEK